MDSLVLEMVRAIDTTVYAIVRQVEWGEHYDAIAIEFLLDVASQLIDTFYQISFFTFKEHGCFSMRKSLAKSSFFNQRLDERAVILVLAGIFQRLQYFGVADEFFRDS